MVKSDKKNKELLIKAIVKQYKTILCNQIKIGHCSVSEGMLYEPSLDYYACWKASLQDSLTSDERTICRINFVLSSMPKKEMEIIWNDFFFEEDKFWWMRKYNRSTYYRIRAKAMNDFIALTR